MLIKGSRVSLKLVTEADLDFICDIESDKSLWLFDDIITDREKIRNKFIDRIKSDGYYDFILQLNDDQQTPIGDMNIWSYIEERNSWEIGYAVLPAYQNKGCVPRRCNSC